jgi:hypothetical protein
MDDKTTFLREVAADYGLDHISIEEGAISVAIKSYLLCFKEII